MTPMVSATIDTAALKHNLQRIRHFAPRSRVMAVIKANAYGHGLVTVARTRRRRAHPAHGGPQ
jgi:alanine racemase